MGSRVFFIVTDSLNLGMKRTILLFGSLTIALLLLFQVSKYSLWHQPSHLEFYIVCIGLLFIGIGIALSRFFTKKNIYNPTGTPIPNSTQIPKEIDQAKLKETGLSKREYEILLLIADGLSNSEIAQQLFISESTVKTHVSKILSKLDAKRRTQAVQISRSLKII